MLQGGIVYAKRLPKLATLATCNNLCRFGWDFSHDLTAICMEIKVEAATKAHGNVSAAMGFMAPAASASAQTAAECGRRIWPGLGWPGAQEMWLPEKENRYASELRK